LDGQRKINGIVFSDLGQASSFMALDWVQQALKKSLGFAPFPATLNVRPKKTEDLQAWEAVRRNMKGIPLPPADGGFCSARLFPVGIHRAESGGNAGAKGAILLPEVTGYPEDKIEIVAAVRLKDKLDLKDGDQLTLEFVN
jgi:CTP-dependent riboflavin kinase